jgi:hypothetical protein
MKYTRMVCFVRPIEKKALKEANVKNIPILFIRSTFLMKMIIRSNDYIVVSSMEANNNIKRAKKIVRAFPKNTIVLYDKQPNEDMPAIAGELFHEPNVIGGLFWADDIMNHYLGIIPDLEKYVENNFHVEFRLEDGSPGLRVVPN